MLVVEAGSYRETADTFEVGTEVAVSELRWNAGYIPGDRTKARARQETRRKVVEAVQVVCKETGKASNVELETVSTGSPGYHR